MHFARKIRIKDRRCDGAKSHWILWVVGRDRPRLPTSARRRSEIREAGPGSDGGSFRPAEGRGAVAPIRNGWRVSGEAFRSQIFNFRRSAANQRQGEEKRGRAGA